MKKYLDKNYYNLDQIAEKFSSQYINAKPFPHIVFDNFFNSEILNNILDDFPKNLDTIGKVIDHDPEQKLVNLNNSQLSENIIEFLNTANSETFISFLLYCIPILNSKVWKIIAIKIADQSIIFKPK